MAETPIVAEAYPSGVTMPEFMEDEDGQWWWAVGHDYSDDEARIALTVAMVRTWGDGAPEGQMAYDLALLARFERCWVKWDADNEVGRRCVADDPEAEAFTLAVLNDD